jgi:tRNA dimethylallyltransferase
MASKTSDRTRVAFLIGPTASGKTAVSILLAERLGAQILSADSRQIYKEMPIGTAQPTADELRRVPHHFVGYLDPGVTFSAGEYGRQARAKIAELTAGGIKPLIVGGSGLYLSALTDDFFSGPPADSNIRTRLKAIAAEHGIAKLYRTLREVDPVSAEKIMPSDYRRIERALEIYYLTGMPISDAQKEKSNPPPYRPVMVGLRWPRKQLYERIDQRCQQMFDQGLVEEVKALTAGKDLDQADFLTEFNALNSLGYAEVIGYLKGDFDFDEMLRLFQRNTRRFAKRQISWFGRDHRINWVAVERDSDTAEVADRVFDTFQEAGLEST